MDEKMIDILDNLDIVETDRLLDQDIKIDIDPKTLNRMKNSVFQRTGVRNKKKIYISRKLVACIIAFAMILSSMSIVGFDNVTATIVRMFGFIPGVGIVENNESIQYILLQPALAENNDVVFTLQNAIATKESITVMFSVEKKNYTAGKLGVTSPHSINLYADAVKHAEYNGSTAGEMSTFTYSVKSELINTSSNYKLECSDYNLAIDFKLKSYDSYNTLEEIGPTAYNNDISITAVPAFMDKKVEVNLYVINKSGYAIASLNKYYKSGNMKKDLYLETDSGKKMYTVPDGNIGENERFLFDIEPGDKNFTLKIPYIMIRSKEETNISFKIPKEGEKITVNQKVEFKDCTMTIVDIEKTLSKHIGEHGELKMTIQYDNKENNKIMTRCEWDRINSSDTKLGGQWSGDLDENDIFTTVYYALEKDENATLRLEVSNPVYYLNDEYNFEFRKGSSND